MEERAIDPSTKYKQYSIGTPWRWDPYTEQEQNPICYYIPVGDGLYRPTMDIRIFANAACSLSFSDSRPAPHHVTLSIIVIATIIF